MKKKLLINCLLFFFIGSISGQQVQYRACLSCDTTAIGQNSSTTIYQYGPVTEYQAIGVADDYGPRIDGDHWHGGVDYNSQASGEAGGADRGDLIISIETGQIRGQIDAGYKRLFVNGTHDFGYGHMFWGNQNRLQSGGCYLREMIDEGQWAIVIIINGDTTAIGPRAGDVIFGSDTLTVRDSINAGEYIGPTGGSSDGNELGPHLHLYSNPDGSTSVSDEITKNPLQYVDYADTTFEVKILNQNDSDEGITLVYPGTQVSTIQVRPKLRGQPEQAKRYHKILDLDVVDILIRQGTAPFRKIILN